MYFVQNGKVVRGQKAACSSSGEWIHYNEGVLYADTHHSLTGYNWQAGKIEETTLEEKTDQYDSEFSKILHGERKESSSPRVIPCQLLS